jgi:predicted kinase
MTPKSLIVTVGVPGSGKSTVIARAASSGIPVVSSDSVRAELNGDATCQDQADVVWALVHARLAEHLAHGSVLLDATNVDPAHRAPLLAIAAAAGATPVAWRLTTWHRTARKANLRRTRVVPAEIMDRMIRVFNEHCTPEALAAEGWVVLNVRPAPEPVGAPQ